MYEPTENDVKWAREVVSVLNPNNIFIVKHVNLIYQINRAEQRITLLNSEGLMTLDGFIAHNRAIYVFDRIDYTVDEIAA